MTARTRPLAHHSSGPPLRGPDVPVDVPLGLPGLIRRQYALDPDAVACADETRVLTRRELELLSDRVADRLRSATTAQGPVLLRLRRGVGRAVAMLGTLKAGRAFLPVDPDEPEARVASMVHRAAPVAVLGDPGGVTGLPVLTVPHEVGKVGTVGKAVEPAPLAEVSPRQPVYVMFTSGSTGEPKGVVLGSTALCSRLLWMQRRYPLGPGDRVLQKTPYTFDPSAWELFWPLLAGARCEFAPEGAHLDPARLAEFAAAREITVCHFVPSMLADFLRQPSAGMLTSLRHVFCSGEALTAPLARRALDLLPARLHNLYGPTEAAIDVTYWDVPPGLAKTDPVPIGEPVDNTVLAVVGADGEPVPAGEPGELWIGGTQLAEGYAGRPDLTEAAFPVRDGRRWYRTGDLVRRSQDGLRYLGRLDDQVKVAGVRAEPLEVEHVLAELHGPVAVVAVAADDGTVLVGVTAGEHAHPHEQLRRHAAARLPAALVPSAWHHVSRFPLGTSGKLDRRRLATLVQRWWDRGRGECDPLRGAWAQALGEEPGEEAVGFVSAGGTSLAAIRLVRAVREATGVDVPVGRLLRDDLSLTGLRTLVAATPATSEAPSGGAAGWSPLAPEQRRLWLLGRMYPDTPAYNVGAVIRFAGEIRALPLRAALEAVVRRHDILRARVVTDAAGTPWLRYDSDVQVRLEVTRTAEPLDVAARRVVTTVLDDREAPMLRAVLTPSALILVFNHLVADQETVDLVVAELAHGYGSALRGEPVLPEPAPSYAEYATTAAEAQHGPKWSSDLEFWRDRLAGAPPELTLPFRLAEPRERDFAGQARTLRLPPQFRARLEEYLREHNATTAGFFLAVFAAVLSAWSGQDTVVVGLPSAHRRSAAPPGLAGFLVDTLPVRLDVADVHTFSGLLRHARERYTEAMDHAAAPFDAVVAAVNPPQAPGRDRVFQVWLNDLTGAAPVPPFAGIPARAEPVPVHSSLFDLGLYLFRDGDELVLQLVRSLAAYPAGVARELLAQCARLAERVLAEPDLALAELALGAASAAPAVPEAGPRTSVVADFLAVAAATPDAVALTCAEGNLTYAELVDRAHLAAAGLRTVTPPGGGAPVLIHATRDADLPVAVLACWLAGAPAALVDAALPRARFEACRQAIRPAASITGAAKAAGDELTVEALTQLAGGTGRAPEAAVTEGGVSHFLLTSGTTGTPLPVTVSHGPLRDFLRWYLAEFDLGPRDRFALLAGPGHDPVLREMFAPLLAGGRLFVPPPEVATDAGGRLLGWLAAEGITVLHATPALLELVLRAGPAGTRLDRLRLVVVGGAPLSWGLVRRLRGLTEAEIVNGYGTTETPQLASCHRIRPGEGDDLPAHAQVPVGAGAANLRLDVRTQSGERGGEPAAVGQRGEVVVYGRDLADGYALAPAPGERFTTDPDTGLPAFRTGDLGRWGPDGLVHLDGRADRQVELDGHRIELGEIEATALRHPLVRQAVAERVVGPVGPMLTLDVTGVSALDESELRAFLRSLLPRHAVPAAIRLTGALDLTPNGKPRPHPQAEPMPENTPAPIPETRPDGGAERALAAIAQTIRGVLGRDIGPDENFFDAGLTSLALVQLHEKCGRELAAELAVTDLFAHPNLRALRRHLSGETAPRFAPSRATGNGHVRRVGAARRELRRRIRSESERP